VTVDLRAERLNRGLSLREAAERMGLRDTVLHRAEERERMPHPRNAKLIADFYGYKVTDIWPVESGAAA
jgi:lambda repressor-like predicted transcriptional regulator